MTINLDERISVDASYVLEGMGLDLKTAINMFLHQVITERGMPFQPYTNEGRPLTDEDLEDIILKSGIPVVTLESDGNGFLKLVDKDEHPEIYDWMVNG